MRTEVQIPAPLEHQQPILASAARYKVARCGRRFGKTRLAFIASIVGHGPMPYGEPLFPGISQGVDVVWLAPDFPQARAIWREEIKPRFAGVVGTELHEQERRLSILGGGNLEIRSAEAVDGIRGRKLGGVVIDEAAWLDLEYAWKDVLLPALLDLGGWALIVSTPNAGPDGHVSAEGKRSPSYFNILCEKIMADEMGPLWSHFHAPTHANKKLKPEDVEKLVAEYPAGSPQLLQEIYAELITAGAGVAFPEWRTELHVAKYDPSGNTRWAAGMDWGFAKPGAFVLAAFGPDRGLVRWDYYFKETPPYQVAYTIGKRLFGFQRPEWVALDSACWAVNDGGPTVAEEIQRGFNDACGTMAPTVISAPKGPGSRVSSKMLVHQALAPKPDAKGVVHQWGLPQLQFHPDAQNLIRTLPRLPRDEKNPEDVDTAADDHGYDSLRYLLMCRVPRADRDDYVGFDEDKHPGYTKGGTRKKPWATRNDDHESGRFSRPHFALTLEDFE